MDYSCRCVTKKVGRFLIVRMGRNQETQETEDDPLRKRDRLVRFRVVISRRVHENEFHSASLGILPDGLGQPGHGISDKTSRRTEDSPETESVPETGGDRVDLLDLSLEGHIVEIEDIRDDQFQIWIFPEFCGNPIHGSDKCLHLGTSVQELLEQQSARRPCSSNHDHFHMRSEQEEKSSLGVSSENTRPNRRGPASLPK